MYSGPVGDMLGHSRNGDVSAEVETDVTVSKGCAMVNRRLIPLAGDEGKPASSVLPVLDRSRELLEQAVDNGMAVFRCVSF